MSFRPSIRVLAVGWLAISRLVAATPEVGPFFEAGQPFFQSQVEVVPPPEGKTAGDNFVVRGILLPAGQNHCVLFDQELLRVAAMWEVPPEQPPVTLRTMPQISYADSRRKAGNEHPRPTGPIWLQTGMHPGVSPDLERLMIDPRAPGPHPDAGRGPLAREFARFEAIELRGDIALVHYRSGRTAVREWHDVHTRDGTTVWRRHLEIGSHAEPLHVALGAAGEGEWTIAEMRMARSSSGSGDPLAIASNSAAVTFLARDGELIASIAPSGEMQRISLATIRGAMEGVWHEETPVPPARSERRRWPQSATAPVQLDALQQNGLALDRVATPDDNPWRRRVRVADIAFVTDDRAAIVTYDGDVWMVDGFDDPALAKLTWRRFASGLHESLAIAFVPGGGIQVATKNGVMRLHDRDGNGEADWCENFNDGMIQSQTTRSFPLDMAIGPDGATYVSQGGIVTRSGMPAGGEGTAHTGGIVRISADGKQAELFAAAMREPFLAVHPRTGVVTATDQQGHFIPSSVTYFVRKGDDFGFPERNPARLTPPLAWLPHEQDISSGSQAWMLGASLGPWDGKLLHLSYGTGRLFLIAPDLAAPTPQGAVIPLDLKTDLPLLHARMNRRGDALFLAGFQIWGTRTTTNWALGRLRRGATPVVTALEARSVGPGIVLRFAAPLDPASLQPERTLVRAWNYRRSSAYGSGRYTLEGPAGTTALGVAQIVLSSDRTAVFIHLPQLTTADQLEIRHDFALANGTLARGAVYFTIHQPASADLAAMGFPVVDLSRQATVIAMEQEPPATPTVGRTIAENLGCLACHSLDGSTAGKTGPTWKGLFGSTRHFSDGTSEVADELYLREKILDPQQKKSKPGPIEMPSYRGVMTEQQLEAVILYIRSIGRKLD